MYWGAIIAIIILIIIIIKIKGIKIISNPLFLFTFEWIFIVLLNKLNLFGFYKINERAYILIGIGVLSFFLGYKLNWKTSLQSKNEKNKLNKELMYFLCIICLIYFLRNFFQSIFLLMKGYSFDYIRSMTQDNDNNVKIYNFLHNFIFLPSAFAIEAITISELYRGKKDKVLLISNFIIILFRVIGDAGRTPLFNIIFYLIIGYFANGYNELKLGEKKVINKNYKIVISCLLILLLSISVSRSPSGLLRIMYIYFAMPPNLFNYWINYVDTNNIMTYGLTSFNGVFFALNYLIKNIFMMNSYVPIIEQSYNLIALTDSEWIKLMPGQTSANAYVSLFFFFYADFKVPGIIIFSMLYGMYARRKFNNVINGQNPKSLALYLLLMQSIYFSFIRFYFAKMYFIIAILLVYILYYKKEKKNYEIK